MAICKHFSAALVASLFFCQLATAQVFYTENFDYADGDLSGVSGGLWAIHSGFAGDIQVVDGSAVITSPGSSDHNRFTGAIAGVNDVWFYAVRFTVELGDATGINNDYFIHFKDETTFGFNARLALDDPANAANDFSLSVWASSEEDGQADWNGDFSFGEEITCVMRWNNGTGAATLWVNPVNQSSTNITDVELADAMRAVESVALRQDSGFGGVSSVVSVDALSVGTNFDAVLAAIADTKVLLGDVNCDGVVDLLDVTPFVAAVTSGTFNAKADINGDGVVDLLDVAGFIALITG